MQVKPSQSTVATSPWADALPDVVAFAGGLSMAWFLKWETTDLVWSLWLSSLVVGYATILWTATRDLRDFFQGRPVAGMPSPSTGRTAKGFSLVAEALALIVFFSFHFGGFHIGHSVFLSGFFPLEEVKSFRGLFPPADYYLDVLRRYWTFLPVAFLAERSGFFGARTEPKVYPNPRSAAAAKKAQQGRDMAAPYFNVMRMHVLIFFFALAFFAGIDNFVVFAVVYAAYFFPWRLLRARSDNRVLSES